MKTEFEVQEPSFMQNLRVSEVPKEIKRYKITVAASMGV